MRLGDVLAGCAHEATPDAGAQCVPGQRPHDNLFPEDIEITGIEYDSRNVREGSLFAAIKGENYDGHDFIQDSVKRGAACIVCDKASGYAMGADELLQGCRAHGSEPFFVRSVDVRDTLACISSNFYMRPSSDVPVIGVTGTNGKTTTTYLIKSIIEAGGSSAGLIGTIGNIVRDREYITLHTTPEAPDFQRLMREMVLSGCSYVVTEVSSHALAMKRVDYTEFRTAVFTNLTMDHLDFHKTMESYYQAKKRLFTVLLGENGTAVINADDECGRRLNNELSKDGRHAVLTYGVGMDADVKALNVACSLSGLTFDLEFKGRLYRINSQFIGMPNVYNILASFCAALALDIPPEQAVTGIGNAMPVKGRMERVNMGQDFLCLVDYAHTPDALERLISAVREISAGPGQGARQRIITVFGCGGNRDRGKRPVMGEIATRLSDHVILTSDNPRREDAISIIREIESGINKENYTVKSDRRDAINTAVQSASSGDVVIVAGKGHEDYQEIGGVRYRFSDTDVLREALSDRLKGVQSHDA